MIRAIISGGPGTGKTTLLNALKALLPPPKVYYIPEPAERVIVRELKKEKTVSGYKARLPLLDYSAFAPLVITEGLKVEAVIPDSASIVIQDRSLIDNIAYGRLSGSEDLIPEIQEHIQKAGYTLAFLCDPLPLYVASAVRQETEQDALRTHNFLVDAYRESGLQLVFLPPVSVEERVAIVRTNLGL